MLVLDELSYAKELIKNNDYGRYVRLKDLVLLAKYYAYEGLGTREIRKKLTELCLHVDKNFNEITQGWKISVALREMKKRKIRLPIPIPVTQREISTITSINDIQLEKILFVFLVYAKILKYNNTLIRPRKRPRILGSFYVNEKLTNIFSVAGVYVKKKERTAMIHALYTRGFLDATKYNGFVLKYVSENARTAFMVEDYTTIPLYYLRYRFSNVKNCDSCGKLFIGRSSKEITCHNCKQNKRREEWRIRQKKHRELNKNVTQG